MKKIFLTSLILSVFLLTGCGKYNEKTIVKDINKKINAVTGYHIEGTMKIYNGEDVYTYDVDSSYENDNYRVSLTNQMNNHEQIILRNSDGVYVLTPSLNKSFKFQSNWPENNSQVYILQSLLTDINNDEDITLKEDNGKYILDVKIGYSNNKNLVSQKIYMDKNLNFEKIEVFDESGIKQIKMTFDSIDLNATFNNKYFTTSENMKTVDITENEESTTENNTESINESNTEDNGLQSGAKNEVTTSDSETMTIEDTVYPMYLPSGTYLSTEESVSMEDGERIILTFAGESPFILVEETVSKSDEFEIIPVYGEPTILMDAIGALSDNSANFVSNGIEYYIASESLTMQEIFEVAQSINSIPVMK